MLSKMNLGRIFFVLLCFFVSNTAIGQQNKFDELAKKIINTSANVKPGEVVVIDGGKHTIALMEALAIEAQMAGGMPMIFLESDKVDRSYWKDVPEKYLGREPTFFAEWLKTIDVWISLPSIKDPQAVYADVPEARMAKASQAGEFIQGKLNEAPIRLVSIGYPTEEAASRNQLDFKTYEKMYWDAVNADYGKISEIGNKIKKVLQGAKKVKVTSPAGTDFTFSIGDRKIIIDDGIITEEETKEKFFLTRIASLPGGSIMVAPIETSANGKVVVPREHCRFEPLTGVSFEFVNGKLTNFKAKEGATCFEEVMEPYKGPKDMFSIFSIGLNPALKVIEENGDYRPSDAAGMVWIGIGGNELFGGNNKTQGEFWFPIVYATVEVDGKMVVKDGKLVL